MAINFLNFDDKTTEIMVFGGQHWELLYRSEYVGPECKRNHITNLVVNIGSDLHLDHQIRDIVKSNICPVKATG